jgi:hypothetical protein
MKEEKRTFLPSMKPFTAALRLQLQKDGFKYVQVKGYSGDRRLDYIGTSLVILIPIRYLAENGMGSGIYESLDSPLLDLWVVDDSGVKIFVCYK